MTSDNKMRAWCGVEEMRASAGALLPSMLATLKEQVLSYISNGIQ